MTEGQAVVLDPVSYGSLFQLEGLTIAFSNSDGDNFTKNLITIRAELSISLGVNCPGAVVCGALAPIGP
jgi:hypothetical protein